MIKQLLGFTKPIRYKLEDFLFRNFAEKEHLKSLKNQLQDKPILIVGNGPSLNKTPLDDFGSIASIGMNKIDLLFARVKWRPSMIMCTNNLVVRQHGKQFSTMDIPIYLAWKSRWFLRKKSKNIHYFNIKQEDDFCSDVVEGVGAGATVTYAALQFAYYMGCNPVIIVGVDHSFDKTGGSFTYEKRETEDNNHFDPNYFGKGSYWGVPNLDASEEVFARSRHAFEADGRKVYDATIDGKLQIFDKISIEQAKKIANGKDT
jgi:hypothetical protein